MDLMALANAVAPYAVAMVVVVSIVGAVVRFVPWFAQKPRTERQKLAIDALALVVGIGVGLSGRISPDADMLHRVGDGFIIAALAIKNRDVVVRAMRMKRGAV